MKWPWEKRAEEAEQEAATAQEAYAQSEEHWDEAKKLAEAARIQREEADGWTATVLDIFSS